MTALLIAGQDIRRLSLALVRDGQVVAEVESDASPEKYLSTVEETLAAWKTTLADLDAIAVVAGPGSFTASRVSTTLANTLAFARAIPIFSLENSERQSLQALATSIDWAHPPGPNTFAIPVYDRPPHIT